MKNHSISRRQFLLSTSRGVALTSLVPLVNLASAQEVERVSEEDPTAVALNYKHDAAETEAPEGQTCANCILYQAEADAEWGPCQLFQGRLVAGAGWCSAWSAAP